MSYRSCLWIFSCLPLSRAFITLPPRVAHRTTLLAERNNITSSNKPRSLEELILEASAEKTEADRAARLREEQRQRAQLKRKADREYDAYWERQAAVGGASKDQATYRSYYSLRRNQTLANKLSQRTPGTTDLEAEPRSSRDSYVSTASAAFLLAGAALLKKAIDSSGGQQAVSSSYLNARMIRQFFSYADLRASVTKLAKDGVDLPLIKPDVFSSLTPNPLAIKSFNDNKFSSERTTVLLYWRPSDLQSTRVLSILKQLSSASRTINLLPIVVPKYPADSDSRSDLIRRSIAIDDLTVDRDRKSFAAIGANSLPTVVVEAPSALGENKVLFALEGERALSPVLANAIAAANGESKVSEAFTSTPLSKAAGGGLVKSLSSPTRLAVSAAAGLLYIADTGNNRVLEVSYDGRVVRCFGAKDGSSGPAAPGCSLSEIRFNSPMGVAVDATDNVLYVADFGNNAVRRIDLRDGSAVSVPSADVDRDSDGVRYDFPELRELETELGKQLRDLGSMSAEEVQRALIRRGLTGNPLARQIIGRTRSMLGPTDVAKADAFIYVSAAVSRQVWRVEGGGFSMRPVLGSGLAGQRDVLEVQDANSFLSDGMRFVQPAGLVSLGPKLVVVDSDACSLRLVDFISGTSSTLVGGVRSNPSGNEEALLWSGYGDVDAPGYKGQLQLPSAAAAFTAGSFIFADTLNNKIKKVTLTNSEIFGQRIEVITVLGGGALSSPQGVAVDRANEAVYVADTDRDRILVFDYSFKNMREIPLNFERIER